MVKQSAPPVEVGVREVRAHLSHYLRQARAGIPVRITSRGEAPVELRLAQDVTVDPRELRKPGWLNGEFWMADDFDAWPVEIQAAFDSPLD